MQRAADKMADLERQLQKMISDGSQPHALREQLEGSFQRVAQMQAKRALRRAAEEALQTFPRVGRHPESAESSPHILRHRSEPPEFPRLPFRDVAALPMDHVRDPCRT